MTPRPILVTGGNRGIGRAICQTLASRGWPVLLAARSMEKASEACASLTGDITPVRLDLSDADGVETQMQTLLSTHSAIGGLVNNAAILRQPDALSMSRDDFYQSMQTNVFACYETIRILAPRMVEAGYGRIVNLSSGWGSFYENLEGPASYSISKAAVNALTVKYAQALPDCVKINSACPGWVRTDMGGAQAELSPEQGAETPVWLATLPEDGPTGGFFRAKQSIQW